MSIKLPKLSFITVCRSVIVLWLLVLSVLVFSNLNLTTQIINDETNAEQSFHLQVLDTQLVDLSEMFVDQCLPSRDNPYIRQTEFSDMQRELRTRIAAISEQLDITVLKTDLEGLQIQLEEQREALQKLQESLTAKPTVQTTTSKTKARQPRPITPRNNTVQPFKVLGVELRGGERFLSVKPTGSDGITSIELIRIGQQTGGWQLETIEGNTAVFKAGTQAHRIAIPQ